MFTFSVHCSGQSFPREPQPSDLDVSLPAGTADEAYLQVLLLSAYSFRFAGVSMHLWAPI